MNWLTLQDFLAAEWQAECDEWERIKCRRLSELIESGVVGSGTINGTRFQSIDNLLPMRFREDDRVHVFQSRDKDTLGQARYAAGKTLVEADVEEVLQQNALFLAPLGRTCPQGDVLISPTEPLEAGYRNLQHSLEHCEADSYLGSLLSLKEGAQEVSYLTQEELQSHLCEKVHPGQQELHIVQGPPGSGKTYLIGMMVSHWAKKGYSVLVTAFTNRAVDEMFRKAKSANTIDPPVLARIGRMRIREEFPDIISGTRITPWPGRALGTTLYQCAKAASADPIMPFDIVIIDEGSQVTLPAFCAAARLAKAIVLFGDHRQLPPVLIQPISEKPDINSFQTSAFEYLIRRHKFSCVKETRRMNKPVCDFISKKYYEGKLFSHAMAAEHSWETFPDDPQWINGSNGVWHVISPDETPPRQSSENEARVVADLIAMLEAKRGDWLREKDNLDPVIRNGGAGSYERRYIVSCLFREQVALVRHALEKKGIPSHLWQIDTVERNQGQTGSIAILCVGATDPKQGRDPSWVLDPRRWNVALSRGRFAAFVIAKKSFSAALRENAGDTLRTTTWDD